MIDDPEAPMTQAQADILRELCEATGEPFDPTPRARGPRC